MFPNFQKMSLSSLEFGIFFCKNLRHLWWTWQTKWKPWLTTRCLGFYRAFDVFVLFWSQTIAEKVRSKFLLCENRWNSVCAVFLQLFEMFEHVCSKKIITVEVFYIWYCFIEFIFILKLLLLHKTYIDTIYIYDIYTPGVWNMFVLYFLWVERLKPSKRFFHSKQGSQFVFHIYIYLYDVSIFIFISFHGLSSLATQP